LARLRVGLTGGLASGKSTVARRLARAGFAVWDADRLIAGMHRPGGAGARAVRELFGEGYLRPDGGTDSAAVAKLIFTDAGARARLEAALHPLVQRRFEELAAASDGIAVLEATKLVETGLAPRFDYLVTVEGPLEARVRRAVRRGLGEDEARARIAAQADESVRTAAADLVLNNDGTLRDLGRAVDALVEELERRAASPAGPS